MRNIKTILFKIQNMEIDKVQSFDIVRGSKGFINDVQFEEDLISKVEVAKLVFEKRYPESVFIKLYSGNFKLGTIVADEDYVLEIEEYSFPTFRIRKAEYYDYKKVELSENHE